VPQASTQPNYLSTCQRVLYTSYSKATIIMVKFKENDSVDNQTVARFLFLLLAIFTLV
jgi:hypothetical protein